jgi:hypothetical protein
MKLVPTERLARPEFRIPISPTASFFAQVRFFNFALRRLGGPYSSAKLLVVVGDRCDIDVVRSENKWSEAFNVAWERVPDDIFDEFGMYGTCNWRLTYPTKDADIIILSDADTVLLKNIDPILSDFPRNRAAVKGHMAHFMPPSFGEKVPASNTSEYWPYIFDRFGAPFPIELHNYSMDADQTLPKAPAYFNLGFVALNSLAVTLYGNHIMSFDRQFKTIAESHMRCQIALTVLGYLLNIEMNVLPAEYNAANDVLHLSANNIYASDIRVLHYLRVDELDRSRILMPDHIDAFLNRPLRNSANVALQRLVKEYRATGV